MGNNLIDRQAAIDALTHKWDGMVTSVFDVINSLPSAQPERKTGKWINAYPDIEPNPMLMYGICSVCGFEQSISDKLKYCPNCGTKMEGEEDG